MRTPLSLLAPVAVALLLTACGSDKTTGPRASNITIDVATFSFTSLGQNHQFSALDAKGRAITTSLTWSSSNPAIMLVNADGLATATGTGTAVLSVGSGASIATSTITVRQAPSHVYDILGDRQSGPPSQLLPSPLIVQVTDALNHPVAGALVHFAAGESGGTVGSDTATTDYQGLAQTTFTLGANDGAYTATATVDGTSVGSSFNLQTGGPFSIELQFISDASPSQIQAFTDAANKWEAAIRNDLPDDYASLPEGACGNSPALDRPIDDVLIFVNLTYIDGPGGILGQAGPCFGHSVGGLPAIGIMNFDVSDLEIMEGMNLLTPVITHEMGHVLGFGTYWNGLGLLADPALDGGLDPHFTGAQALAQFDALGGAAYANAKVPVELFGGAGTADSHWRESVFDNELMTGYVNEGSNPLSAITLASMGDLGYTVDLSGADPYTVASPARPRTSGVRLNLGNDIIRRPFRVIAPRKIAPPYRP